MKNGVDVFVAIASLPKDSNKAAQNRYAIQVARRLRGAESSVQVAAYSGMPREPRLLADMVNVVGGILQADDFWRGDAAHPVGGAASTRPAPYRSRRRAAPVA